MFVMMKLLFLRGLFLHYIEVVALLANLGLYQYVFCPDLGDVRVWFQNVFCGEMIPVAQPHKTRQLPFFDQRNARGFSEVIWMPSKVAS